MAPRASLAIAISALLIGSPLQAAVAQISIGPNIQVSQAHPNQVQAEVILDIDPTRPGHMIACSLIKHVKTDDWGIIVYLSTDGGKTWTPTFEEYWRMDPTCTYGVDGTAFLLGFGRAGEGTFLYRSPDGGRTWQRSLEIHGGDRPYLTVDRTGGKYHGRLYNHANVSASPAMDGPGFATGMMLYTSTDSGRSFGDRVQRESIRGRYALGVGNGVIFSDGTLGMVTGELSDAVSDDGDVELKDSRLGHANGRVRFLTSSDGGKTLSPGKTVADFYMHVYPWRPAGSPMPWIAVDASTGPFRDRVYAAWPDRRSGRNEILVAHSDDKGNTWSAPVAVNDDRPPAAGQTGPNHMNCIIATNKDGAVVVTWYDRRDHPDNLGWDIRATASLDGGDTWLPNVRVSEKPNVFSDRLPLPASFTISSGGTGRPTSIAFDVPGMMIYGGDTQGLAADGNGTFHLVWSDNRTGTAQLWGATLTVAGRGQRHGDADLAKLEDLSGQVEFVMSDVAFDRSTKILTAQARLKNVGTGPVRGLKVRVLQIDSQLGVAEITNADNGKSGAGALWGFEGAIPGGTLAPGATSDPKPLRLQVKIDRGFLQGIALRFGLANLTVRVLGSR